ncbi:glycosyltransferase 87 family protein [Streptomyces malaysiensis]|uniref:Mannosyltransferase n=1 Tax=Streptomyces malaysiensis TaxID=92644 RepID=A0A7X6AYI7_STRMQ|nr:glycosyltransferase 87 family protein [Streptomyces malaysiensis]NIY67539.1 mannosyltransferase [Streptomyces malaysiensis]
MTATQTITDSRIHRARAAVLRRPVLWAAVFCLLSFTGFWIAQRAAQVSMVDLLVYRAEGWTVRDATDLYDMRATQHNLPNTYPPFAALLFTPLTVMGTGVLRTFGTALNLVLMVAVAHLSLRLVDPPARVPRPAAVLALAAAGVWCEPVWTTLRYGQINLLVTALVLGDLTRRAGHRWAGVGTGIATGIKLTPGLFVVFLGLAGLLLGLRRLRAPRAPGRRTGPAGGPLWRGFGNDHLRRAAVATATFALTVGVSALALPHDSRRFWTEVVFATDRPGDVEGAGNQNLKGALARLLHTPDPGMWWLTAAVLVGCAGLATAVAAQLTDDGRLPNARAWAALTCAVTALMVSPVSWSHHWVWAVPMVLLLAVEAVRRRTAGWTAWTVVTGLLFCSFMVWYAPHSRPTRVELHQNPAQMLLTAVYPLLGLAFLGMAAYLTVRAVRRPWRPWRPWEGKGPVQRQMATAGAGARRRPERTHPRG